MHHGFTTFEEILEELKTKIAVTNLRNRHEEIKKLISYAEREINPYSGHLVRKKMLFWNGNGNFNGFQIKKPNDFVSLHKVGGCDDKICSSKIRETPGFIVLCDQKEPREKIEWMYWGYQKDSNGNILTTRNHAKAVINYIIWSFIQQRYFMKEASLNEVNYWKEFFEETASAARGEDFFPDSCEMDRIFQTNLMSSADINRMSMGVDCCLSKECVFSYEEEKPVDGEPTPTSTPPIVSDNETDLVPFYIFKYLDFTKNYTDTENHPPGKFVVESNTNVNIGRLYFNNQPIQEFPFEKTFSEISNLTFKLNLNIELDNETVVIYDGVNNISEVVDKHVQNGWIVNKVNYDYHFYREVQTSNPLTANFYVFLTIPHFTYNEALACKNSLLDWFQEYKNENNNYTGNLYFITTHEERWLRNAALPYTGIIHSSFQADTVFSDLNILPQNVNTNLWVPDKNAVLIMFNNESHPAYHSSSLADGFDNNILQPTLSYANDFQQFATIYEDELFFNFFKGLIFQVIKQPHSGHSSSFVLSTIAALEAKVMTSGEIDEYDTTVDISLLETENPYENFQLQGYKKIKALKELGWEGKFNVLSDPIDYFPSQNFKSFLTDYIGSTITVESEQFTLIGTPVETPSLCFDFAVKEQSNEELKSETKQFCFMTSIENVITKLWSFQFENHEDTIDDAIEILTDSYLENTALEHTEASLLTGKTISFTEISGRIGFAIQSNIPNKYIILDQLNNNITNIVFDKIYDASRRIEIYVSKELYSVGDIYFKLQKIE